MKIEATKKGTSYPPENLSNEWKCCEYIMNWSPKSWNLLHFQWPQAPKSWNVQFLQCTKPPKTWNLLYFQYTLAPIYWNQCLTATRFDRQGKDRERVTTARTAKSECFPNTTNQHFPMLACTWLPMWTGNQKRQDSKFGVHLKAFLRNPKTPGTASSMSAPPNWTNSKMDPSKRPQLGQPLFWDEVLGINIPPQKVAKVVLACPLEITLSSRNMYFVDTTEMPSSAHPPFGFVKLKNQIQQVARSGAHTPPNFVHRNTYFSP